MWKFRKMAALAKAGRPFVLETGTSPYKRHVLTVISKSGQPPVCGLAALLEQHCYF
jgi:hypothetical protein